MKRIVVLGAGESGIGAARLAKIKGYQVFVSDNRGAGGINRNEAIVRCGRATDVLVQSGRFPGLDRA